MGKLSDKKLKKIVNEDKRVMEVITKKMDLTKRDNSSNIFNKNKCTISLRRCRVGYMHGQVE